ncbi:MAG: hypothetical protein ABWX83_02940 [Luteibacter sp.]
MDSSSSRRSLWARLHERTWRPKVRFDRDAGVVVMLTGGFGLRDVPIERIRRIEAGNRDTGTVDTLWLFIHVDGEPVLAISEVTDGFATFVDDLAQHFPGVTGWQAALPPVPFQLTSIDLWKRPSADVAAGDEPVSPEAE